jgi:hypothetical protein
LCERDEPLRFVQVLRSGRIGVKLIHHLGDEAMNVFRVE